MLTNCISSKLKIDDKTGHIGIPVYLQFFSYPVPANFHTPHRDVHQGGNLFGGDIQTKVGTKAKFLGSQIRIGNLQPVQKIFVHFIKSGLKNLPLLVMIEVFVYFNDQ